MQTYEDLIPTSLPNTYIPKIYGFKIYKKKGSRYAENKKQSEITHYSEEHLKKIKTKTETKKSERK